MAIANHVPGDVPQVELFDDDGNTARIAPGRGAIVTSLRRDGCELLYLDEATLRDPNANVRGGVPVLFPAPGKLAGDQWALRGRAGAMKQHGFARQMPWEVIALDAHRPTGGASATLRLRATPATLKAYPWAFVFDITYGLAHGVLRIAMSITNEGDAPMPFGAGFHPYFQVPQTAKMHASIPTMATRVFDNVMKEERAFDGFDLGGPEVDAHLLDHGASSASLLLPSPGASVMLRASPEFSHWVVWTLAGKDFVCLEPWTSPGNALNTGERLQWLEPSTTQALWVEIDRA